jgi:hypothetical protein
MILGMKRSCVKVRLVSQLHMVLSSTPSFSASSFRCSSGSSRRILRCSPRVLSCRGDLGGGGVRLVSWTCQKGGATVPLRLLRRPRQGVHPLAFANHPLPSRSALRRGLPCLHDGRTAPLVRSASLRQAQGRLRPPAGPQCAASRCALDAAQPPCRVDSHADVARVEYDPV